MLGRSGLRTAVLIGVAGVCVLVWLLPACGPTKPQTYRRSLASTGPPALHAVHNDRLTEVMEELRDLTFKRLPQEFDYAGERERGLQQVKELAAALGRTADDIPAAVSAEQLSEQDQAVFASLTEKLRNAAGDLGEHADAGSLSRAEEALGRVASTCNACHSLFRDVPPAG